MRGKTGSFNLWRVLICLFVGLALISPTVYAADKAVSTDELEKAYQELKAIDAEAAEEFVREAQKAVSAGEIDLEKTETTRTKDTAGAKEKGLPEKGAQKEGRYTEADFRKRDAEFNTLLKEGKTHQQAEKIMREKYGGPGDIPDRPDLSTDKGKKEALDMFGKEKDNLLKEGFSKDEIVEIEKMIKSGRDPSEIFEKHYGEVGPMGDRGGPMGDRGGPGPREFVGKERPDGRIEFGPGDRGPYERFGPERFGPESEGRGPKEFEGLERPDSRGEMDERFRDMMGREPTEQDREMMDREYERMQREGTERPEYEAPEREFIGKEPPVPVYE